MSDVEDAEHDRGVIASNKPGALRMLHDERPCLCPSLCDFSSGRRCKTCKRKSGPSVDTVLMTQLSLAVGGGLRLQPEALSMIQWTVLGMLKKRDEMVLQAVSRVAT